MKNDFYISRHICSFNEGIVQSFIGEIEDDGFIGFIGFIGNAPLGPRGRGPSLRAFLSLAALCSR